MGDKLDPVEFSKLTMDHLNRYIKLANQKASILLTAQLAFLGIYINGLRNPSFEGDQLLLAFTVLTVSFALISAFYAARTIYPNTPETDQGLFLWKSITQKDQSKYRGEINNANSDELLEELIDENYQLARVSKNKYENLRHSILSTGLMVFFALLVGLDILFL